MLTVVNEKEHVYLIMSTRQVLNQSTKPIYIFPLLPVKDIDTRTEQGPMFISNTIKEGTCTCVKET